MERRVMAQPMAVVKMDGLDGKAEQVVLRVAMQQELVAPRLLLGAVAAAVELEGVHAVAGTTIVLDVIMVGLVVVVVVGEATQQLELLSLVAVMEINSEEGLAAMGQMVARMAE
jgi:hypothetical protein